MGQSVIKNPRKVYSQQGGDGSGIITQTITNGDTTHSPSGDAAYDALQLKADYYAIDYGFAAFSPLDLTNYAFNSFVAVAPVATFTNRFFGLNVARTIKSATFVTLHAVNGTGETCTLKLYNLTTAADVATLGTFVLNGGANSYTMNRFTGLTIAVNATDNYCWKLEFPTFATNPTNVSGFLTIDYHT